MTLNWLPPPVSVTSFVIEAGSFPRYADLATFDTSSPVTSAVFFNVGAGYYYVRVRARNGADVSAASNEVLVTVEGGNCTGTLYAPDFRVTGAGSSVSLTWDAPTIGCPPTEYVIEAGSARGGIDLANFRTGSAVPRYDATGVGAGTYYLRMRAANDVGVSYASSEKILVFSSGCLYAVGPSTVFISRGGIGGGVSLETSPNCSWTISADAPWLSLVGGGLPVAGQGSRLVAMNVNVNLGPVQRATLMVRWPGGGADVPVTQNGFGFFP